MNTQNMEVIDNLLVKGAFFNLIDNITPLIVEIKEETGWNECYCGEGKVTLDNGTIAVYYFFKTPDSYFILQPDTEGNVTHIAMLGKDTESEVYKDIESYDTFIEIIYYNLMQYYVSHLL